MKPTYEIENAFISSGRLWGNIKDHPNCTNGHLQMTSPIVDDWKLEPGEVDIGLKVGDIVETENSVYHIKSVQAPLVVPLLRPGMV